MIVVIFTGVFYSFIKYLDYLTLGLSCKRGLARCRAHYLIKKYRLRDRVRVGSARQAAILSINGYFL